MWGVGVPQTYQDWQFKMISPMTPGPATFISAIKSLTTNPTLGGSDAKSCQIDSMWYTLQDISWRNIVGSNRILVMLTNDGFYEPSYVDLSFGYYMNRVQLRNILLSYRAFPIILSVDQTMYTPLVNRDLGFGIVTSPLTTTWSTIFLYF